MFKCHHAQEPISQDIFLFGTESLTDVNAGIKDVLREILRVMTDTCNDIQSVKCYRGGRNIDLIPPISEIKSQT